MNLFFDFRLNSSLVLFKILDCCFKLKANYFRQAQKHGRVKVRTSEEEKARKEKERQEKLKIFKNVMEKIQSKRKQGELDKELLHLSEKILLSNPDIYTLWNIRRDIIMILRKNEDNEENLSKLCDAELQLTEYCLKINPKSYCAWHHREWVLTTRPDPDWEKEVSLCNIYLKLDERNFHTWDYRRFVIKQCKSPLEDEFNYTTEKLLDNFSNYSAWHYRSKMLVQLYPDLEGGRPIQDSHHKHELKMVQSAAFTDPDDTSAWFYQRWLLGAVKTTINLVVCTLTPSKVTVAFSKNVPKNFVETKIKIAINNNPVNGDWISCTGHVYDNLWILKHKEVITEGLDIEVEFATNDGEKQLISCIEHKRCVYIGKNKINFQKKYSLPVIEELKEQLKSCRQLLDLEPDNKWTLLTTTVFLHCIDTKVYHKEAITNLHSLKNIDKLRTGYYDDLITKWNVEEQLSTDYSDNSNELKIKFPEKITSLPHLQYYSFCEIVDFSNQNLTSKVLPSLVMLQHCKKLSLAHNKLTTLKAFPTLKLVELDLQGNVELAKMELEDFRETKIYKVIF